jgi:methionyl-tRNA formyltransferase
MTLRLLIEADLPLIFSWRNVPEFLTNLYPNNKISEAEHMALFASMEKDRESRFYAHLDEQGILDGVVYFTNYTPDQNNAFWGIFLGKNAKPGTGIQLGIEGLKQAFNVLKLYKLSTEALSINEHECYLLEKLGFKQEGLFKNHYFDGVDYIDVIRLGLQSTVWAGNLSRLEERMDRLENIRKTTPNVYTIHILTDKNSWITPYLYDLAEEWEVAGHTCVIAFNVDDLKQSDFCFCLSFSKILHREIRSKYKNTLVVHESDLPKGRGWAPMSWQILDGESLIPVTLLEAEDDFDSGSIYLQEWIELKGTELNPEWRAKQAISTIKLCKQWVDQYPEVNKKARKQEGEATYYVKRKPKDSKLNPNKSLLDQFNLLRIVDNDRYPAHFRIRNKLYCLRIDELHDD